MTDLLRIFKTTVIALLKIAALAFVGLLIVVQIPEIQYDFGPDEPLTIASPEALDALEIGRPTFVAITAAPDFSKAFIYQRYGLNYTYFMLEPYGLRVVVRTYDTVTDEWNDLTRFVGKLRPFREQPFSRSIAAIYRERYPITIPEGAYFLALGDVPKPSGWQVGAVTFASLLWLAMCYFFFFFHRKKSVATT